MLMFAVTAQAGQHQQWTPFKQSAHSHSQRRQIPESLKDSLRQSGDGVARDSSSVARDKSMSEGNTTSSQRNRK